ncbi:3-oxoacyl-[acyl-carrier-protein] reductase FabG [Manduca sexta]|uniref:3-oxoacyl-[acyl-carrier-protein] reductase FabG n=1 Tax=Manduca sexta TaxID=7130 RepID=UPI00188F961F|nr:3-oxoacyl-[acyl-carrier-protein] reductase FabG [Manduca sexta]
MLFEGKVVIITGGSSGIGAATAELFSKEGAKVAIVGRNDLKLKAVEERCTIGNNKPLVIKADITNYSGIENIIQQTIHEYGKLDILINCAGQIKYASILSGNLLQVYDDMISSNLRPVVSLTVAAAPYLIKNKGCIVNISSLAGTNRIGVPEYTPYGLSKAGVRHFSRGVALALANYGVRVNTITPGAVKTQLLDDAQCITKWNDFVRVSALKRISEPKEIADVILYLASDNAKGITGANFVVDNGMLIKK